MTVPCRREMKKEQRGDGTVLGSLRNFGDPRGEVFFIPLWTAGTTPLTIGRNGDHTLSLSQSLLYRLAQLSLITPPRTTAYSPAVAAHHAPGDDLPGTIPRRGRLSGSTLWHPTHRLSLAFGKRPTQRRTARSLSSRQSGSYPARAASRVTDAHGRRRVTPELDPRRVLQSRIHCETRADYVRRLARYPPRSVTAAT